MNAILAFLILAICLVAMPPGKSQALGFDHEISFVADVATIAPAVVAQEIGGVVTEQTSGLIVSLYLSASIPDLNCLADKHIIIKLPAVQIFRSDRLFTTTCVDNYRPPNSLLLNNRNKNIHSGYGLVRTCSADLLI